MHINRTEKINITQNNNDMQQKIHNNENISIWGNEITDKNNDGIINAFDFDNDEKIICKLKESGLLGKSWTDAGDKVYSLLNVTNKWIVQNNQSVTQIAIIILNQTKPDYTNSDIKTLSEQLISINKSKLDGSKKGFLVNSEIELPIPIDISKEKQAENPLFDYVWATQFKRINDITSKYNLLNKESNNSEIYRDALELSNEFIQKFGYLNSSSREYLILAPHFDSKEETNNNIIEVRKNNTFNSTTDRITELNGKIKQYKTANCFECSELLTKMCFDKFNDKYEISTLLFKTITTEGHTDSKREHVAMLLKSKDGKERFVIDPWVSPQKGGVFEQNDWEKMIKEIYQIKNSEKIELLEDDTTFESLKEEKVLYSSFYEKQDLIKNKVSEDASKSLTVFGNEVLENLINKKNLPEEIITLFKEFCKNKYQDYLKILELEKHSEEITKEFPDINIKEMLNDYHIFIEAVRNGIENGNTYSKEILDLYLKCGYRINPKLKKEDSASRITKTDNDYLQFEKIFNNNHSVKILNDYLNGITDNQATLVTLEKHYEKLITDIYNQKYNWENRNEKKELIMSLVNFVSKVSALPEKYVSEFEQTCIKELNTIFYTDKDEILKAFKSILSKTNSYYQEHKYFDYSLWLEK